MFSTRCPTADKLEAFAKTAKSGCLAEHVRNCPTCRKIVSDFRDEAMLVAELQRAAAAGPAPSIRRRLRNISHEAVFESGNGHRAPPEDGDRGERRPTQYPPVE